MAVTLDTTLAGPTANSYASLDEAASYFEADAVLSTTWAGLSDAERMNLLISATRAIDRQRWRGGRLAKFRLASYGLTQALAFPRDYHPFRVGQAASGSTTSLTDAGLAENIAWLDDYFAGGSVLMTSGANQGLIRAVTAFASATGQLTLSAFPGAISSGDGYCLIWPLGPELAQACLEQAGHIQTAGAEGLNDLAARGVSSASLDGLSLSFDGRPVGEICARAMSLLRDHRARGPKMERS